jgi:hypothetical protein
MISTTASQTQASQHTDKGQQSSGSIKSLTARDVLSGQLLEARSNAIRDLLYGVAV